MFVDSHAHLDSEAFQADLESVMERARKAGVETILTIGCLRENLDAADEILALPARFPGTAVAFGVHPHDARFFGLAAEQRLVRLMAHPAVAAWGEIGLDYHYDHSPRDDQKAAFRRQVELARRAGKPVIIHTREADLDTVAVLEEHFTVTEHRSGVLHCFSSDWTIAERCLERGFYISVGGMLTFKNAGPLRETVRRVPADRILIETDSPFLAPVPFRGRRNEPAWVVRVAETLAEVLGMTTEEVGRQTRENFRRLFNF